MPFGIGHEVVCLVSRISLWSFFSDIKLEGLENVPADGPMIVAATHHNMIVDAASMSVTFPGSRRLHYWAKDSMFRHPNARRFLNNCGVIPVDRKTKNNAQLYKATFDILRLGELMAVFPEGTSHTLPRLSTFKDGTSFAALEYAKSIQEDPTLNADGSKPQRAVILPVGIVYPDKSKYRSVALIRFGKTISVDKYMNTYMEDPKKAAKELTRDLEQSIEALTINAPDWDSRDAAEMARSLLFPGENGLVNDYVTVTQSLIFAMERLGHQLPEIATLQQSLLAYKLELDSLSLRDSHIAKYNEKNITAASTTLELLRRTAATLIDLPLFLPGLVGHLPLYVAGYYAGKFEIYEEVRAQNKIFLGIALVPFVYIISFLWAWRALCGGTFFGFFVALATLGVFVWYHNVSIDERYDDWKDLLGRWRLFDAVVLGRGMWRRKKRILELKSLRSQNLAGIRHMIKKYRDHDDDVKIVWTAIRSRARQLGSVAKLRGKRKALAKQYEWSFEG